MAINVGICGMGVVGRQLLREIAFNNDPNVIEIRCLSDPNIDVANLAYLLKYDSVYHGYEGESIDADTGLNEIIIGGKRIRLSDAPPTNVGWGELDTDIVFDCTGRASYSNDLQSFMDDGAKGAISLSADGYDNTLPQIVCGVNETTLKSGNNRILMPQIETQVAAHIVNAIYEEYGVESVFAHFFTAYTNAQNTIDSMNSDYALGRAAAWNITPLSTSAAKRIGNVLPDLAGRLYGIAYRAPVINGGVADLTLRLGKSVNIDDINKCLKQYTEGKGHEYVEYAIDDLVSSDATALDKFQYLSNRTLASSDGNTANVSFIYDNIRGQVLQAIRLVKYVSQNGII